MTKLLLGDARDLLWDVGPVDTVITDPVWPNCPAELLPGWDHPQKLLSQVLHMIDARRVVVILRNDSDPRFLQSVPARWPFFCLQVLAYRVPNYHGRKLGGTEIAYCFGEPIPPSPGKRVVPCWGPKVNAHDRTGHPCSRALGHTRRTGA